MKALNEQIQGDIDCMTPWLTSSKYLSDKQFLSRVSSQWRAPGGPPFSHERAPEIAFKCKHRGDPMKSKRSNFFKIRVFGAVQGRNSVDKNLISNQFKILKITENRRKPSEFKGCSTSSTMTVNYVLNKSKL